MKQDELMTVMMDAVGADKLAQIMKKVEGADLDALLGKVLADPNLGKLLEGADPSKLLPGGKVDAGSLLEKLFPKAGDKPAEDKPAGDRPAEEKPAGEKPAAP